MRGADRGGMSAKPSTDPPMDVPSCTLEVKLVLVGDAAHTSHPQAGQGVNLGFLDAQVLCEEVLDAFAAGVPFWTSAVLGRYQRRRYLDNLAVQRAMDGFEWLFAHDLPWKRPLRQLTLMAGRVRPAAQALMRLALDARPGSR